MQTTAYPSGQPRRIRTFHARHGRLSQTRLDAVDRLVPELSIDHLPSPIDLRALFPSRAVVIDFGSGMGHHTLALAKDGYGVLAMDVHTPGIARVAVHVNENSLPNVRVHLGDGQEMLEKLLSKSVDQVHVLFPDPWPKPRHHKRRLIQSGFLAAVHRILKINGTLLIVTDDDSYATHITDLVALTPTFAYKDEHQSNHSTRYQRRAESLNHTIHRFTLTAIDIE